MEEGLVRGKGGGVGLREGRVLAYEHTEHH